MAKNTDDCSKKHFHWTNKVSIEEGEDDDQQEAAAATPLKTTTTTATTTSNDGEKKPSSQVAAHRKKLQAKLRSVIITAFNKSRLPPFPLTLLGPKVIGTLFGHRRGHVHFALQKEPNSPPAFLIELATPISGLVQEMASGLVRIALECDKEKEEDHNKVRKLLEEPVWRTYCNGKKSGFATKRECGEREWKVLRAVEMISMGAGVLPSDGDDEGGEVMYMRAKFERVVGSRDSEAYYMMNPDCNGAPELSVYLLRV